MAEVKLLLICFVLIIIQTSSAFFFSIRRERQLTSANISVDEGCVAMGRRGDCQFYRCFNERHSCPDSTNYAIKYGFRFCSRFDLHYNRMTAEGKRWLNGTRLCAMEKMLDLYRLDSLSCSAVDTQMKARQAACEAENGLCRGRLIIENKDVLSDVYSISRQTAVRFLETVKQCAVTKFREVATWFQEQLHGFGDVGESVRPFLQEIEERMGTLRGSIQSELSQLRDTIQQIGQEFGPATPEKILEDVEVD